MATTTTTATIKVYGVEVMEVSSDSNVRIQEMMATTTALMNSYFSHLLIIPNSVITCMNTWMQESGFEQFHYQGNSRHNTIVTGRGQEAWIPDTGWKSGSDFRKDYWTTNTISQLRRIYGQLEGFVDGLYAHGISACMGAYLVENTTLFPKLVGKSHYASIAKAEGISIPVSTITAGGRITDIFPDDVAGRRRSILAGLIVMDDHYRYWLGMKTINSTVAKYLSGIGGESFVLGSPITPRQALLLASGSYLGGYTWKLDANRASPYDRASFCRDNRLWVYKATKNAKTSTGQSISSASASPVNPVGCTG